MKILVINGSPKGERSDTLKITRAFLKGMGDAAETVETIDTMQVDVKPCRGCYACWRETPGNCVQRDGMAGILERIRQSDLVIWSAPLYCYGVPSNCKAVFDRLLPLSSPEQYAGEDGRTHHTARESVHAKMALISGCGFPDRAGNFDALEFSFERMFGRDCPMILCVEAPLLSVPEAKPLAERYLALAQKAGREYAQNGAISDETQEKLDAPMFPPEQYRAMAGR